MSLGTAYWTLETGEDLEKSGGISLVLAAYEEMLLFMPLFLDILKRLSQYLCFARLIIVGGHFLKWRTSNIFCPFSPDKIDINWIEYGK